MEHDERANKEENTQTYKEGKVNKTQVRSIRAGQTIKNVGERTKCKARKTQEVKAPEGNRNTRDQKNDNTRNKHREKQHK